MFCESVIKEMNTAKILDKNALPFFEVSQIMVSNGNSRRRNMISVISIVFGYVGYTSG